jgi:cellulose synthase/poly-beta-1,6-N-acetylglucosamine synthase-like glycosyltransferase
MLNFNLRIFQNIGIEILQTVITLMLALLEAASAAFVLAFALLQVWLSWQFMRRGGSTPKFEGRDAVAWPNVLVQLPVYNEGLIVKDTLAAIASFDYPQNRLRVQVLDDSTDETASILATEVAAWKEKGLSVVHIRRIDRKGFKAGALANGLAIDGGTSEFVAIFDADFLPQRDFLLKTVPAFQQRDLAFVQTRWSHRNGNDNLLSRLMATAIDTHFSIEQGGRHAADCFINFNGTAGVWSIAAIESAGGWSSDSLTEDLDLSFRAQIKGWKSSFLYDVQTPAEVPGNMSSIRTQQHRWTKGAAEVLGKLLVPLWASNAPWRSKIVGSMQLGACLQYIAVVAIGLTALLAQTWQHQVLLAVNPFVIIMLNVATLVFVMSFFLSQRNSGNQTALSSISNIGLAIAFAFFATGFSLQNSWAVLQGIAARKTEFVRTPKGMKQKHAAGPPKGLPRIFYLEAGLAAAFGASALVEFVSSGEEQIGLFLILSFYAISYALMVIASLLEVGFSKQETPNKTALESA